eukprot:6195276-Pleurochrysis_carterae.AAC.2
MTLHHAYSDKAKVIFLLRRFSTLGDETAGRNHPFLRRSRCRLLSIFAYWIYHVFENESIFLGKYLRHIPGSSPKKLCKCLGYTFYCVNFGKWLKSDGVIFTKGKVK